MIWTQGTHSPFTSITAAPQQEPARHARPSFDDLHARITTRAYESTSFGNGTGRNRDLCPHLRVVGLPISS